MHIHVHLQKGKKPFSSRGKAYSQTWWVLKHRESSYSLPYTIMFMRGLCIPPTTEWVPPALPPSVYVYRHWYPALPPSVEWVKREAGREEKSLDGQNYGNTELSLAFVQITSIRIFTPGWATAWAERKQIGGGGGGEKSRFDEVISNKSFWYLVWWNYGRRGWPYVRIPHPKFSFSQVTPCHSVLEPFTPLTEASTIIHPCSICPL